MAKLWSSLESTTYSRFVLIIDESSGFDGTVKFVYIARRRKKNDRNKFNEIPSVNHEIAKLLSAKEGRDVHGPLPLA